MRLHGLISWYDEPCSALAATLIGLRTAQVDHVIAVDGAYLLYPDGKPSSSNDQAATIQAACRELGMGCTIHTPQHRWAGNEVEKRTRMFSVALAASDPGDWWLNMDADMVVTQAPGNLKQQLENTEHHAAYCTLSEPRNPDRAPDQAKQFEWHDGSYLIRLLFRAQPLRCDTKHCVYKTNDDRVLWAPQTVALEEPAISIPELVVEHRDQQRPALRTALKQQYYERRDRFKIETNAEINAETIA
jgi:hypothetical protein